MQAAQQPAAAPQPATPTQAPFMQGASTSPNFGIQPGAAPNPDLMNTLDNLFGKK